MKKLALVILSKHDPVAINILYHIQKGAMYSITLKFEKHGLNKWDEAWGQRGLIFPPLAF